MGILSWIFGKNKSNEAIRHRDNKSMVISVETEDETMNWAIEKARLTLHYFEKCLKSPKEGQQYFSIKVMIEDGEIVEYLWLTEPNFDTEGNLFGMVGNEPLNVKNVKINQNIGIDRSKVSDWMIIEKGRLIGGYTIRVLRDKLSGKDLESFDKSLGGMYIDKGEDYFLPNDSTPEGAIVKIEEAYNEKDIEKAKKCKDFSVEAKLMLSKIDGIEQYGEIVEMTAKALELSFVEYLQEKGMPNFHGVRRAFTKREKINDNHIIITEVCIHPNNTKTTDRLNTYLVYGHWKVLGSAD